jgi:hypothetical protein
MKSELTQRKSENNIFSPRLKLKIPQPLFFKLQEIAQMQVSSCIILFHFNHNVNKMDIKIRFKRTVEYEALIL